MATIQKFEDLICWQKARALVKFVYDISKSRHFEVDRGLQDQIRRAAISVMSNIAEGFDRGTKQEFINYLYIAKGSCGEVRAQLYAAHDVGYVDSSTFRNGMQLTDETSRLIASFTAKLKSGALAGSQRKPGRDFGEEYLQGELDRRGLEMTINGLRPKKSPAADI